MGEITTSNRPSESNFAHAKPTIIDLTHPLISSKVPACNGHPKYATHCLSNVARGDPATFHSLSLGTHTGTHIDAPYHFLENGITVDKLDLSLLTAAPAVVVDLRGKGARERITWEDLAEHENRLGEGVVLLLCTGWSKHWCQPDYPEHPYLDAEAARKIIASGVKVIGADTMSPDEITENGDTGLVHKIILGNGGAIVENMNGLERLLDKDLSVNLRVSLLPLKLTDCDGSPIRAVAWLEGA